MKSDLQTIPGVGSNMERHLLELGYSTVDSLKGADPEEMYIRECRQRGGSWIGAFSMFTGWRFTSLKTPSMSLKN